MVSQPECVFLVEVSPGCPHSRAGLRIPSHSLLHIVCSLPGLPQVRRSEQGGSDYVCSLVWRRSSFDFLLHGNQGGRDGGRLLTENILLRVSDSSVCLIGLSCFKWLAWPGFCLLHSYLHLSHTLLSGSVIT